VGRPVDRYEARPCRASVLHAVCEPENLAALAESAEGGQVEHLHQDDTSGADPGTRTVDRMSVDLVTPGGSHAQKDIVDRWHCCAFLLVRDRLEGATDAAVDRPRPSARLPGYRYRQPAPSLR